MRIKKKPPKQSRASSEVPCRYLRTRKWVANELAQDDRDPDDDDDDIKDLWVISGPIFEGDVKYFGSKQIAIPTGFYKIIVRQKSYYESSAEAIALYYPHEPKPGENKEQFVSVDLIEDMTDLDFHPNLKVTFRTFYRLYAAVASASIKNSNL